MGASFENLSVIISIISVASVYLYFFYVLRKTKYFSEISIEQEKYSAVFWGPLLFLVGVGAAILAMDFTAIQTSNSVPFLPDFVLFFLGIFNLIITIPIPYFLKRYFYNFEKDNKAFPEDDLFVYEFIDNFRTLKVASSETLISDSILITTILLAGLGYVFNCNVLLLIFSEICLLLSHFWSSQLRLIPKMKITIELKEKDDLHQFIKIPDIFIITTSPNGYFVILDKNNTVMQIMKDSVHKIIYQKDNEPTIVPYSRWDLPSELN